MDRRHFVRRGVVVGALSAGQAAPADATAVVGDVSPGMVQGLDGAFRWPRSMVAVEGRIIAPYYPGQTLPLGARIVRGRVGQHLNATGVYDEPEMRRFVIVRLSDGVVVDERLALSPHDVAVRTDASGAPLERAVASDEAQVATAGGDGSAE